MSTSEQFTFEYSPCPCGNGVILQHVDSPDNPWSGATSTYELSCPECNARWILDNRFLYNRAAYEEKRVALNKSYEADKDLEKLCGEAIESIMTRKALATYKDEYIFLKGAGICSEGPIRYKRFRTSGKNISDMCRPSSNLMWLLKNLHEKELSDRIVAIRAEINKLNVVCDKANKRLETTNIASLKKK